MNLFSVAIKNIRQTPLRSVAIFLAIFVLSASLLGISLLYAALAQSVERTRHRLGADAMIVPAEHAGQTEEIFLMGRSGSYSMGDAGALRAAVLADPGVAAATAQVFLLSAPLPCCSVADTMLIGYEPETDFVISPWMRSRRSGSAPRPRNGILIGADIMGDEGARVRFFGREFTISGKLERTGMPYLDNGIFIPMQEVRAMVSGSKDKALRTLSLGPDDISCLLVKMHDDANADAIALRLEHAFPGKRVITASRMLRSTSSSLLVPLRGMSLIVALQWLLTLFLIGVIYKFAVDVRRRELGVLLALGATDVQILTLLVAEMAFLAGAAGAAGIIAGLVLTYLSSPFLSAAARFPVALPEAPLVAAVAAGVFIAALSAGLIPTAFSLRRWSKSEPFHLITGSEP